MDKSVQFQNNVQRWKKFSPNAGDRVAKLECLCTEVVPNADGNLNLLLLSGGKKYFLHSQEDPVAEATQWFDSLDKQKVDVLYIYGIGLGYVYDAAKEWLLESPLRTIVFIEDNLEIIRCFLETERATCFLYDKQVWLEFLDWDTFVENFFKDLVLSFSLQQYQIAALPYYAANNEENLTLIHSRISFWMMIHRSIQVEQVSFGELFFSNYYRGILDLPTGYRASELYGKFGGIPAVICGAGPSLDKNLALVETLSDKALVFAGATSLNAVNSNGFVPHFGVGVDPNPAQATRLIANKAFEVPFLYRGRMNIDAFNTIHGDRVYVTGSSGYRVSEWFEKELNIPGFDVNEGCNVVNFSLSIAHAMGCNPIILVGVDLAYSDKRSYHTGVTSHPTHSLKLDFTTKHPTDELVIRDDIFGQPVYTLWKWVAESTWFSQFALSNQDTLVINATEGGIGMPQIPNKPLSEVITYLLNKQYDLHLFQHGELQNAAMPSTVTLEKIEQLMQQIKTSLLSCLDYLQVLHNDSEARAKAIEQGDISTSKSFEERDEFQKLIQEPAFVYILSSFNDGYKDLSQRRLTQLYNDESNDKNIKAEIIRIESQRYAFVARAAEVNVALIHNILFERKSEIPSVREEKISIPSYHVDDSYTHDNDTFTVKDAELGLSFHEEYRSHDYVNGNGRVFIAYPSGSTKMEQFLLNNRLHGPVTYYKEDGSILARSWYVNGNQEGKTVFYHVNGQVHSIRRFLHGQSEGIHEYYYPNGQLKSLLPHSKGKLNGMIRLYYPNGNRKREMHFENGLRHGIERLWNSKELLIMEAEYQNDRAHGKAKKWHDDGQLALEITYDDNGKQSQVKRWDTNGILQPEEKFTQRDYFDQVAYQADLLTKSLDVVNEELRKITPLMQPSSSDEEMKQDFNKLDTLLKQLHSLNKDFLFESGIQGDNPEEAIWKTPTIQREMEKKLQQMTEKLSQDLQNIQKIVGEMNKNDK